MRNKRNTALTGRLRALGGGACGVWLLTPARRHQLPSCKNVPERNSFSCVYRIRKRLQLYFLCTSVALSIATAIYIYGEPCEGYGYSCRTCEQGSTTPSDGAVDTGSAFAHISPGLAIVMATAAYVSKPYISPAPTSRPTPRPWVHDAIHSQSRWRAHQKRTSHEFPQ